MVDNVDLDERTATRHQRRDPQEDKARGTQEGILDQGNETEESIPSSTCCGNNIKCFKVLFAYW